MSDTQLRNAMRFLTERMKIVVEPTGCLGAAAVFERKVDFEGKRVGMSLSGENLDLRQFSGEY